MGRTPCCSKVGLHRGAWSSEEDKLLMNHIQTHGEGQWRSLPSKAGLLRCGKSCRLRWMNYLRPGFKRGNFTSEENDIIIQLRSVHGNRWSLIATELPGRTDNEIKNHWNAHLRKAIETTGTHHSKPSKTKNVKKKRKMNDQKTETTSQEKSTKVKVHETSQEKSTKVKVHDPAPTSSSSVSSSTSSKNESGASSTCTFDFVDADFDFAWSNWTQFMEVMEVEGTSTMINGQQDECFLMDDGDIIIAKDDESLMFESLYDEYLNLLNNQEDVEEGN